MCIRDRGWGLQVAEDKLEASEVETQHGGVPKNVGVMGDRTIKDVPATVIANPGQRVIVVLADTVTARFTPIGIRFLRVHGEQDAESLAAVRVMNAKELVAILERLTSKDCVERVRRVVEPDPDRFGTILVVGAARPDHETELRPILDCPWPLRKGNRRAMNPHETATTHDEFGKILSQH